MDEFFNSIIDNNNIPILTALVLGLMTAISPCPLATNITATAYNSKNISSTPVTGVELDARIRYP